MDLNAAGPTALPRRVRIARTLLLLPLPLLAFMLLSLPLPRTAREWLPWAVLVVELVLAVSCFIGLGRRSRWSWTLATALAVLAAATLAARTLPALVWLARGQGSVVLLLAVILSAATQTLLFAAGLLAWLARRGDAADA